MRDDLPPLALSIRQPWAWAVIHAGKDVENRSLGSIRAGRMRPGRICIHAASSMRRAEYDWAVHKMQFTNTPVPRPEALIRRAIIGMVDVVEIITSSDSPWFGGEAGLRLENPAPIDPVPCSGALGYFEWQLGGTVASPLKWMLDWGRHGLDPHTDDLFDLPAAFSAPPERPFRKS